MILELVLMLECPLFCIMVTGFDLRSDDLVNIQIMLPGIEIGGGCACVEV
jgi:hypothetical protein